MKPTFIFLLCVGLPPSNPAVNEESSLYFEWIGPMSLQVRNRDGDEDQIELHTSPKIGDISVECLFVGQLDKDRDSSVAVLGCKESEKTMIVIVSGYSSGTMFTLINHNKKIVELNMSLNNIDYEEEELGRTKRSTEDYNYDDDYVDYDADFDAGEPIPPNLYYEFGLSYDSAFLTKMNGNKTMAEEYVSSVVTLAQTYLKRPTLGTNVHFKITKKIKYLEGQEFKINPREPGVRLNLGDATKIRTSEALIIFTYTDNEESWRGVSSRRQACSATLGRALVKHREDVQKAALTMAHEMGHLFGNYHDGKEDNKTREAIKKKQKPADEQTACQGQGIMTDNSTNRPEEWSSCSRDRLFRWYTRQGYNCLKKAPPCNNTGWFSPCSCGVGSSTNLCNIQNEGYCEHSTSTCVVSGRPSPPPPACAEGPDFMIPCICGIGLDSVVCGPNHILCAKQEDDVTPFKCLNRIEIGSKLKYLERLTKVQEQGIQEKEALIENQAEVIKEKEEIIKQKERKVEELTDSVGSGLREECPFHSKRDIPTYLNVGWNITARIPMNETIFHLYDRVDIPCQVNSSIKHTVSWAKNGLQIVPNSHEIILNDNTLVIAWIRAEDTGTYTCSATNGCNENEASVNIDIATVEIPDGCEDNPYFANCILIVRLKYCESKYYSKFCCRSCTMGGQEASYYTL